MNELIERLRANATTCGLCGNEEWRRDFDEAADVIQTKIPVIGVTRDGVEIQGGESLYAPWDSIHGVESKGRQVAEGVASVYGSRVPCCVTEDACVRSIKDCYASPEAALKAARKRKGEGRQ